MLYLGDLDDEGYGMICKECETCLTGDNPKIPPKSYCSTGLGGEVPSCLEDLTLPERLMICAISCKVQIVKLVSYGSPSSRQRFVKGNSISFVQDVDDVAKTLPDMSSLASKLKVCFVGDETCPLKVQQIRRVFTVRRAKVQDALKWLCDNNECYKMMNIGVNQEEIDDLTLLLIYYSKVFPSNHPKKIML